MGDWLQDRCNEIQKAQQEHIQKSFGSEDIEKARAGVYKPTKQNLKEGKAGQKYGSEKKEKEEGGSSNVKTFNSAKELKEAIKDNKSGKFIYSPEKIKSINGYSLRSLSPDITNKNVSVYDPDTQSNKYFYPPFKVEFR